jgi:hypothetical protein
LFKDIYQALLILDKMCIDIQKGMLEFGKLEVVNAHNIQPVADLLDRVKEHFGIDDEFLGKMQSQRMRVVMT